MKTKHWYALGGYVAGAFTGGWLAKRIKRR